MQKKFNRLFTVAVIFVLLFSCFLNETISFAISEMTQDELIQNTIDQTTEQTDGIVNNETNTTQNEKPDYEAQIEDLENKKENAEKAITSSEAQIGVVEGVLSKTLEEIEQLSTKIEQKKNEITNLEMQEVSLMNLIEQEEKKLEEVSAKYEKEKTLLEKRLVVMYEMGNMTMLDVLFNSKSLSDFLSRYFLLAEIGQADRRLVDSVKKNKTQTESISQSLTEKKNELEKDKDEKEKYKILLNNMEILKSSKIVYLNEEEAKLYQSIEQYRQEISDIESEIKEIALKNLGQQYIGGKFIWPTPGYTTITSPFGYRTHPITGIYKLHTGMDIGAPYGTNFLASNDGVVVKAEYNGAYGNMVVINHGGGVMTLYAHGSEILVSEGDIVKQGQAVLKVGSTGYSTGPHAHFEIRINGEYLDPADYITPDNGEQEHDIEKLTVIVN